MGMFRFFYSSACHQDVGKSALAALRRKTGATFANCRQALKLHNNDQDKAEAWLKEQIKKLGWVTANKVQNRQANQGLIGIAHRNKKIAMVEVNSETDFVAKNEKFKAFLKLVSETCLNYPVLSSGSDMNSVLLCSEALSKVQAENDTLADHLAVLIGSVGENLVLRRAFCFETVRDDVEIAFSVHPPCNNSEFLYGKYGSFISFHKFKSEVELNQCQQDIASSICQHIIGMAPTKIGDYEKDEPFKDSSNENALIHQEYLLDDTKTVGQLLSETGIKVIDFKRFECGEPDIEATSDSDENEKKEQIVT